MEEWEELDVDDSDLPSLLRPCKRQHHQHTPDNSHKTSHLSLSQPNPITPSQTLFNHSPTSPHSIPGPAAAIQAAMHSKTRYNENLVRRGEDPIPTQEYLRSWVEDSDEDEDFKCNSWLCAVEFLHRKGLVDGVVLSTPLSSIKKCSNAKRVDQVVAIIKSCTPNGLGDMMVTLKDPMGTIGASIHRKVLTEGEFGKDISVDSVLILQKVAVFSPSRSAHYLNITLSNVVKVIRKDSGPPLKQNYPASTVKHATPGNDCSEKPGMLQKAFSLLQRRTEEIMDDVRQNANVRGSAYNDKQNASVEKEPLLVRQYAAEGITKEAVRIDTIDDNQRALDENATFPEGGNPSSSIQYSSAAANSVENLNDQEVWRINGVKKQKQPLISRASLPQWTDEQLDELFAVDGGVKWDSAVHKLERSGFKEGRAKPS